MSLPIDHYFGLGLWLPASFLAQYVLTKRCLSLALLGPNCSFITWWKTFMKRGPSILAENLRVRCLSPRLSSLCRGEGLENNPFTVPLILVRVDDVKQVPGHGEVLFEVVGAPRRRAHGIAHHRIKIQWNTLHARHETHRNRWS